MAAGTGTHDNGSYIDLPGSGFQAKGLFPNDIINAKHFAGVGDGTTDDILAIQAAIDYIGTVGRGTLDLGGAPYAYEGQINLVSNLEIRGPGKLKHLDGSSRLKAVAKSNIWLHGFEIDGDMSSYVAGYTDTLTTHAVWIDNCTSVWMDQLHVHDVLRTSLYVGGGAGATPSDGVWITNCEVHDIGSASDVLTNFGNGPVVSCGKNIFILNNYVHDIYGTGGINVEGTTLEKRNIHIKNNIIEGVTNSASAPTSGNGISILDAVPTLDEHRDFYIEGNKILSVAGSAIYANKATNLYIRNNEVDGTETNGIRLLGNTSIQGLETVVIAGNVIKDFGHDGIVVTNGEKVTVTNNLISDGQSGSDQGITIVKPTSGSEYVVVIGNRIYNIQTDGMSVSGNNVTIQNNSFINIGQVGSGLNYAIEASGSGVPLNNKGDISNNYFDDSSGTVSAFLYAQGDRWADFTYSNNSIVGTTTPIDMGTSTTVNIVGGYYPAAPDVGTQGSTASWKQGDRVLEDTVTSGGFIGYVCTVAGSPGTWKGYGAIA